ncbi:MAG: helix-hairpin-helix domain-containing protein [Burkholderiaceae bacterium]|nr:helix-hairpin-helix domain-containing protein [Burkholderiaceae bacterium]
MNSSALIGTVIKRCGTALLTGAPGRTIVAALLALGCGLSLAVDANSASAEQLEGVRGIGPAISARIITERTRAGAFLDMDDLRERVKGIGVANLKKFAAAGLTVGAPGGAIKGAAKPPTSPPGASALRQSWVGRSGVVYFDPGPAPDGARPRLPTEPHAPAAGAAR